ncbi:UvrD/REP helicase [Fischerella sp. NIES-4106]|nr:UvrD/REP helicase [Fischerella sp. NIES-4106]
MLPNQNPKFPVSNPKFPVSNPKLPVSNPKLPVSNPKFLISNPKFPVSNPKFPVSNPKLSISNSKFLVSNPKFPVSNPKFFVLNSKLLSIYKSALWTEHRKSPNGALRCATTHPTKLRNSQRTPPRFCLTPKPPLPASGEGIKGWGAMTVGSITIPRSLIKSISISYCSGKIRISKFGIFKISICQVSTAK